LPDIAHAGNAHGMSGEVCSPPLASRKTVPKDRAGTSNQVSLAIWNNRASSAVRTPQAARASAAAAGNSADPRANPREATAGAWRDDRLAMLDTKSAVQRTLGAHTDDLIVEQLRREGPLFARLNVAGCTVSFIRHTRRTRNKSSTWIAIPLFPDGVSREH